nr:hypothetical protein [uncultured Carboxylicivirga sp.]
MYKLLFIQLFIGFSVLLQAQNWKGQYDSLMMNEQYLSAYELLSQSYVNDTLEVTLLQSDLAINFYAYSHYHRFFGFENIRKGELLDDFRKSNDLSKTNHYLPIDTLLFNQMVIHPGDYRIQLQLAKYYNAVFLQFGDRWGKKSEWLLDRSQYYFTEAFKHGVYDYYSLYAMGYYNTLTENYHEARYWFNKSLQIQKDPLTYYNLAVSCLFDGMFTEGVASAVNAYELYTDSLKKGDAARISGILYLKLDKKEDALDYFIIANNLSPNYKPNQLYLLKSYLSLKKLDEAKVLGEEVLMQNIYSPDLLQELLDMFEQEDQLSVLHDLFDDALVASSNDAEAKGNVLFHYAKLEFALGNKNKTKRYLKRSKKEFQKTFDSGHQAFQAIDQMLEHL